MRLRIAIVGAGMAGLTCGSALRAIGHSVVLFDKGARVGGRVCSRRIEGGLVFDYGVGSLAAGSTLGQSWNLRPKEGGRPIAARIGTPDMNAVATELARNQTVRSACQINALSRMAGQWHLGDADGNVHGPFDWVIVAVPAPQVRALAPTLSAPLGNVRFAPCWSMMVAFAEKLPVDFDLAEFTDGESKNGGVIARALRESAKPGRVGVPDCWVIEARPDWSRRFLEESESRVAPALLRQFGELLGFGLALPRVRYLSAHRWRFARTERPLGQPYVLDPAQRMALIGDWCLGDGVEHARRSGALAAAALVQAA